MKPLATSLPDDRSLERALRIALSPEIAGTTLSVTARHRNPYESAAPSEIVTCRVGTAETLQIFCKYDAGPAYSIGHRGGTKRESEVYRRVIEPLGLRPTYLGTHVSSVSGDTWLFLEYLEARLRMSKGPQPEWMRRSTQWLGTFHRRAAELLDRSNLELLPRYDTDYYVSWVNQAREVLGNVEQSYPWFPTVCRRAPDLLATLTERPQTIIHGECYSRNILCSADSACPVDWESAAIAAGEIDIASITDGWTNGDGPQVATEGELAYIASRWPSGTNPGFYEALAAARVYWSFRWLSSPDHVSGEGGKSWLEKLYSHARAAGLIE